MVDKKKNPPMCSQNNNDDGNMMEMQHYGGNILQYINASNQHTLNLHNSICQVHFN